MEKTTPLLTLLLAVMCLSSCEGMTIETPLRKQPGPTYEDFSRNRKECKLEAEKFCNFPLVKYCTLDVYEKRTIFIKNCMYERGWKDPYNMFSYYK